MLLRSVLQIFDELLALFGGRVLHLFAEDHALLEQCLELKEAKAIKATVQRLPVQVQPYRALRLLVGKHSCKLVA
jgi:hypothetical protein